jgi:hypothetical protein
MHIDIDNFKNKTNNEQGIDLYLSFDSSDQKMQVSWNQHGYP